MKPTCASQTKVMGKRRVAIKCRCSDAGRTRQLFWKIIIQCGIKGMNSLAASSWQNQLFRRICRDLRLSEREEIGILMLQADVVRELRKKLVSDRFD